MMHIFIQFLPYPHLAKPPYPSTTFSIQQNLN
jgi:hypothetical protein